MAGRMISGTAALAGLVRPASDTDEAGVHRVLPVAPELSGLLPGRGLRRGSTVAVALSLAGGAGGPAWGLAAAGSGGVASGLRASSGGSSGRASGSGGSSGQASGGGGTSLRAMAAGSASSGLAGSALSGLTAAGGSSSRVMAAGSASSGLATSGLAASGSGGTSLLLALLSAASQSGSWCAVVGVPALGALAAAESGIALDRLALVPNPGPDWPTVVAALIDGVDVVVVAVPGPVSGSITSRLVARARQRGSVLVSLGPWAGADVTLQVVQGEWEGLDAGHGRLRRRRVTITSRGRGAAARPREVTLWMPGTTAPPTTEPPPAVVGPSGDVHAVVDPGGDVPAGVGGVAALPATGGDATVVAGAFGRADPHARRRTILTAVS